MLLTALLATLLFTESQTQSIGYIADNLHIRTDVVSNLVGGSGNFTSKVTLTNNGGQAVEQSDWRLYFMSIHMVEPMEMLWKTGNAGYEIPDSGFRVYHIAGCLFMFEPTSSFNGIPAGGSATITLTIQNWNVARTDNMPNWFITDSSGNNNMTIKSTATEDLKLITGNYDTANQWKRYEGDKYDPWTPEQRWEMNEIIDFGNASNNIAIPTPMRVVRQGGKPAITKPLTGWTVTGSDELRNEVDLLKATIGDPTAGTGGIQLQIDQEASSNHEGYKITIDGESNDIVISSPSPAGIFYGCQTFLSVYDDEAAAEIPSMIIEDEPRYGYRGMHVDVARHFLPVEDMIKLIKVMGMYKLNKLHFHLTDDEGWRVEMPWCPYLTTTGATQCFDPNERTCQFPQFGSRPDGQDRGSGSYSAEDYKQILSVARDNHVEVIPEVDMPGHARAAIKATKAFLESGDGDAAAIQLVDESDTSQYLSVQLYTDNAVDPCLDSTYEFVRRTVSTFLDYHSEIQPLRVMHVGGDEVAHGAWVNSTACQRNGDVNTTQLAEEFVFRVSEIVKDLNSTLSLGLWEDGAISDEKPFDLSRIATDEVLVHSWQNIWEWGVASRAYKLANAGYKVIMSQATHLYFDHPQEPDPEERGFYWATRYSNIRKTFGFKPDDLYANIDVDRAGNPLEKDTLCKTEECVPLDPSSAHNIIGMQGHVWTETMRTSEQVFDAVFPRMLAMAERAWHKADWESDPDPTKEMEDWTSFANTLGYKELERLERMGISYRIPVPGAKSTNNGWVANIQFPGLAMTYATSDKPNEWKTYDAPVSHQGVVRFRAHSKDNSRTSRVISTSSSPAIQIHVLAIMFSIVALYLAMQF